MSNRVGHAPISQRVTAGEPAGKSSACKPGSVGTFAHTGRSFLSAFSHPNAPAAYPRLDVVRHRGRDGPSLAAYLALLRLGFTAPSSLPMTRWALTPPFHPYRSVVVSNRTSAVCFLLHCPSHEARAACAQALPGNLPCGARTFLGAPVTGTSRPPGRRLPLISNIPPIPHWVPSERVFACRTPLTPRQAWHHASLTRG